MYVHNRVQYGSFSCGFTFYSILWILREFNVYNLKITKHCSVLEREEGELWVRSKVSSAILGLFLFKTGDDEDGE